MTGALVVCVTIVHHITNVKGGLTGGRTSSSATNGVDSLGGNANVTCGNFSLTTILITKDSVIPQRAMSNDFILNSRRMLTVSVFTTSRHAGNLVDDGALNVSAGAWGGNACPNYLIRRPHPGDSFGVA